MNVIIAYLETMFSAYPQTPRLLEAKSELQAMMEDAYSGLIAEGRSHNEAVGQVITDFGNLDELAPTLGITAELGGAAAPATAAQTSPQSPVQSTAAPTVPGPQAAPLPQPITLDEAKQYAEARRRAQPSLAIAVALFVLAPASMFLFISLTERVDSLAFDNAQGALGLVPLLILVAIGVIMILSRSRGLSKFQRLNGGNFTNNPVVTEWAHELEQKHEQRRITSLQIAVGLWILSAVPILLSALLFPGAESGTLGVAATLVIVAVGLLVLLPSTWASDVARELTHGGREVGSSGRDIDGDEDGGVIGVIAAIYWPLLTAGFLAWGFIGNAWDRAWIVWPIGAVLFGAIAAGSGAWGQYRKNRR